ncbi:porin [Lutibacter sp.]|uniref:OprO/OprP family phosphate-selective porin n=1 Tax=Lutibacter sp. TaxID=1925666 RepID=UPI0025BE8F21|nr:porin [Lutibacter sp.]MCF6168017.1 hypothetical protein [Lutibacter sp.]
MMKKLFFSGILFVINFFLIRAQETQKFKSFWNKGYHLESNDGNFKMKFGGRIQQHWSFTSQDETIDNLFGKPINGSEFRRIRFYNAGTLYNFISYKLQLEFAGGSTTVKDIHISIDKLPIVGKFTIGHFKEPFGLDQYNSSNDMSFIERASNFDITPGRNNGFMFSNTAFNENITWAIGTFRDTDNFGKTSVGNNYNFTGRITVLPVFNNEKNKLLHLGLAYSYRTPDESKYSLESRPEAHLLTSYINTGMIDLVDNVQLTGFEAALVLNPFSLQSEYIHSKVNRKKLVENYNFYGYYIEASYFLTGEHKNYSKKVGYFKRVSPKSNFNPTGKGIGAIELVARFSSTDYSDKSIEGGILNDMTIGVNWHLNPATKFSFDYTSAKLVSIGNSNIFQMKFQVAF